ncbi:Tc toxin subunit A-related protein [Pseudomonas capsici]|uniref:Tc toxin subunit A-related protein n=1 Tax=Pseudomonas capsici TaxID=2810614 RepID=UPI0021F0BFC8|nr:neuraminidase-like domain-containing protein [Pseudomonas capsici]MCV4339645.1 neuraminidase-like domain-containing protein [Pseudomonas capsici]
MSLSVESQLNESFRDALVEYYLGEVVPNSALLIQLGLDQRLKTANDLYEFFLLDNQVCNEVKTSHVASAIASLQQYINGALLGMEPGYELLEPTQAHFVEWRDRSSQYPIWAANMQLALYPEVFISPALRLKKSGYFAQLENDINQNKISIDTTQEAVKSYLASFEEVANLTIINGYIDSTRFAEGKYYFIGKSRAENIYYWRMVDMNERAYLEGTDGPRHDHPTPGAWSDWKRADIGVNASTLERTLRPVFFNNRLFVTWVDIIDVAGEAKLSGSADAPTVTTTDQVQLVFNLSYKKYDDSWSAPQPYMRIVSANVLTRAGKTVDLKRDLNSIAAFDISASPESLFIAMYAGETLNAGDTDGGTSDYAFLHTAFVDKNFNTTPAFPSKGLVDKDYDPATAEPDELRIRKTCWVFALKNKANFQFTWSMRVGFKTINTSSPETGTEDWDYRGWQSRVRALEDPANRLPTIDHANSTFQITTDINKSIIPDEDENAPPPLTIDVAFQGAEGNIALHLVVGNQVGFYNKLLEGSTITIPIKSEVPVAYQFYMYVNYAAKEPAGLENFLVSAAFAPFVQQGGFNVIDCKGGYVKHYLVGLVQGESFYNVDDVKTGIIVLDYLIPLPAPPTITFSIPEASITLAQYFNHPADMNKPYEAQLHLNNASHADQILAPSPYSATISFDKSTLRPKLPATYIEGSNAFYITHGVGINAKDGSWIASAIRSTKLELTWESEIGTDPIAPKISKRTDPFLGIAEYIDFSTSSIQFSDGSTTDKRDPIRMNTLFARELINKANIALEALLSWETQQLQEPPIGAETTSTKMDFKGANGLYFWELFLHLPFMISHRLNLEQRFQDAEFWLAFIFDPGRKAKNDAPAYWNVRPLTELPDPDYFMRAPIDPDGIAASDPVRYQKAVYFHYIKNLIDRGDMAYRQLTPDSLGEAKLWYVRILDLLGPRPDTVLTSRWTPIKLSELAASSNPGLREFENRLIEQERQARHEGDQLPLLRLSTFGSDPTLSAEDTDHFIVPMNAELTRYWDMLESRLHNLRHNLTLDGKPLSLPLFAAPLDPRALLAAYANGATEGGAGSLLAQETPHYRYSVMFNRASAAVDNLIQFGATLLSIIERKEQGQLAELQQQQVWEFAQYAIDLQREAQKVEVEARKALQASRDISAARAVFYARLAAENVSPAEITAAATHLSARVASGVAATSTAVAAGLKPVPNHVGVHIGATGGMAVGNAVGVAAGGFRLEGVPEIVSIAAHALATLNDSVGDALERSEMFRRRLQEWENARDQAKLEVDQISAQLAVHDAQTRVTALQLRQAEEARKQAEVVHAFLNKRFTNSQLYQWLNGQFSTFYYQAYDATFSLCLATQACWQYEIADYSASFIQPAAWKDTWRGLTAGESLKLNLLRMDAAYLARHDRKLEIVKTVSVKQLPASTEEAPSINPGWEVVLARLAEEGIAEFEITRAMLDADYPGHYLRRIKRISVSLPVTVGPYQDIRATLTQTWNAVQMSSPDGPLKENMRASQQIAVSTGIDDDGLFVFNFDDERYLPFEGTGAISRWALTFSAGQEDVIASITDIIVHVRYTAKSS